MPAKPSKDFVSYHLVKLLKALHQTLPSSSELKVEPPPTKRQKTSQNEQSLPQIDPIIVKELSKNGILMIGLNKVQKALIKASESPEKEQYVVFVLNDQETLEMNKHVIGFCRQFGIHNFLMPKFLKKSCCDLMGTKRLTCFALCITDEEQRNDLINKQLKEFDNHPDNRENLDDYKYAEESMFKTCYIKRWQVDINPKKQ